MGVPDQRMSAAVVWALHCRRADHVSARSDPVGERTHLGRVEEEVGDPAAMDVVVLVGDVGKYDAIGDLLACPARSRLLEVCFAWSGEAEKPKDRVRVLLQDLEPDAEDERVDLSKGSVSYVRLEQRKASRTL